MQPFERDRQELCVIQKKRGKLQLRCSKWLLKEKCGPKSVLAKIGILNSKSLRASPRWRI